MSPHLHIPQSSSIQIPPRLESSHLAGLSPGLQHLLPHWGLTTSPAPTHTAGVSRSEESVGAEAQLWAGSGTEDCSGQGTFLSHP